MTALALEDFEHSEGSGSRVPPIAAKESETAHMEGYERGYQAGWDDSVKTLHEAQEHLDAELGRNLEELSFSFFEAKRQACLSLEDLLRTMAHLILPRLYQEAFEQTVTEFVTELIDENCSLTVDLFCAPSDLDLINRAMAHHVSLPLTIRAEPSFAPHQVRLQLGHETNEINGSELLTAVQSSIASHFDYLKELTAHVS